MINMDFSPLKNQWPDLYVNAKIVEILNDKTKSNDDIIEELYRQAIHRWKEPTENLIYLRVVLMCDQFIDAYEDEWGEVEKERMHKIYGQIING